MRDKNLKAQIAAKLPPGKRVYNYLVKEYLNMPVPPVPGPAE